MRLIHVGSAYDAKASKRKSTSTGERLEQTAEAHARSTEDEKVHLLLK